MNQMRAALLKNSSGNLKEMVEKAEEKRKQEVLSRRRQKRQEREETSKEPVQKEPEVSEEEKIIVASRTEGVGDWSPCSDLTYKPGSKVIFKGKSLARVGWSLYKEEEKRPVHALRLEQPYTYEESGRTITGWLIADEDSIQKADMPRQSMREIR